MANVTCPACSHEFITYATRDTNPGLENCRRLIEWVNTETPYRAAREPLSIQRRASGARMRPDIRLTRADHDGPQPVILIERQEQNTTGTGAAKIADKMQKGNECLRDTNVRAYYIVIAGKRLDLLLKEVQNASARGNVYPHERLHIVTEDVFKERALEGKL